MALVLARLLSALAAVASVTAVSLPAVATAVPAGAAGRGATPAARTSGPLSAAHWLRRVRITEYYPVPERWFKGRKVSAAGLLGKHRVDWLYGASGVAMEGDGIGLDGARYHIDAVGRGGWVNERGRATRPGRRGWSAGSPFWRSSGLWRTARRRVTFPLTPRGWAAGVGRRYTPPAGITFAPGPSRPLRFYRSVAVDPRLIPLGSLVYLPAYRTQGGWMRAADVGGAILGRHVDVYRPPPPQAGVGGEVRDGERIYVVPPSAQRGGRAVRLPAGIPVPPASL